jgi:hypothetical protein
MGRPVVTEAVITEVENKLVETHFVQLGYPEKLHKTGSRTSLSLPKERLFECWYKYEK